MPLYQAEVAADQPTVQLRRTSPFTLGGAFADVDLDTADVQNYLPVLEKTAADQITAKVTGNYEVSYGCTGPAAAQTTSLRVRKNDSSVLPGSEAAATSAGDAEDISRQFIAALAANDFITVQAMSSAGAPDLAAGLTLTITHLAGQKGATGAASASDVDAIHDNVADEINIIADKAGPEANDVVIIEDSSAGWTKKSVRIGNFPAGASLSNVVPVAVAHVAADAGVAAEAARQDHQHDVDFATPPNTAVVVGNAADPGAGPEVCLYDHQHAVTKGTPVAVGTANAAGGSGEFVAADHVHAGLTRGAADYAAFPGKTPAVAADLLLIEDSGAAGAKKQITIGALPPDGTAIHKAVAGEISAIAPKLVPIAADYLIIEDSADANSKKSITLGSLPASSPASSEVVGTSTITTSGTTAVLMTGMTTTPGAGTYLVWFSGDCSHNTNGSTTWMSIYSAGVLVTASERPSPRVNAAQQNSWCCVARVTVTAGQAIEGRWRTTAATATNTRRSLVLVKVS